MDHEARAAEIKWLRGVVATGSEDITRIHLPLIGHLIEMSEVAGAVALSIVAADHFWARGFLLKAFAVLRRALVLDPENPELTERYAAWKAAVDPDLLAVIEPARRPGGVVIPLRPLLEEQHREQITRCTIRPIGDPAPLRVSFDHARSLPADWVSNARFAVAIDRREESIPCTTQVLDAQRFHHELELTPADAAAAALLHAFVHVDPVTSCSNIAALVITSGDHPPHRVRNIYCLASLGTIAEA